MNYTKVHKVNQMPSFMESNDGRLKIEFINWAEPNNGRMLWQVNVLLDNISINDKLFPNGWNYINYEINRLQLNDLNNDFFYLPVEGKSKLINSKTNHVIDLPFYTASTVRFYGNKFQFNNLIEIYNDTIILTSTKNQTFKCYKRDFEGYIIDAELKSENECLIKYYLIDNGQRIVRNKEILIDEFSLIEIDTIEEKN